jgi:quercetin dioxygenase-like cupin family protein
VNPQLNAHKQGAVNMGNSQEVVDELCAWLDSEGYTLRSSWPKGEPNPFGQYFKGNSYLTMMTEVGPYNVTFEPRCRNNWHIHHGAVQVLICVAGRGWYQEWGKEAVEMTPGTVIAIPEGVKHWHGAAKDSWFQHLGYETNVQPGASNEWLEEVTDEVYGKLK